MEERKRPASGLEAWFTGPYRKRGTWLLFYLILAMAVTAVWVYFRMDNDAYYMIPQGREILENGIPRFNSFTYHGARTVVQQWLYCVGMYLADSLAGNLGLLVFMLAQALVLFHVLERYVNGAIGDPFWSCLAATGILAVACIGYYCSLRPENITLIMVLAQCAALDRWRDTGKKRYLFALPAIMLFEANVHISMWPIHACVYLAYLFPAVFPWLQEKLRLEEKFRLALCPGYLGNDGLKPSAWLYGMTALSFLVLLANPYGWDGVMYLPRSMKVFGIVAMSEQLPPELVSDTSVMVIGMFIALWTLAKHRAIGATEACLAGGFTFMACINHHNSMFLIPAAAALVRPALRLLAAKKPSRAADLMPNGVKSILYIGVLAGVLATCMVTVPGLPEYKTKPEMDPAIGYILSEQQAGKKGNVLNNVNTGPMMEYAGVRNLFGDTRPELLLDSIGKTGENPAVVVGWACSGLMADEIKKNYGSFEAYLDAKDIRYVVDMPSYPIMSYLCGWLEANPDWELVEFGSAKDYEAATGVYAFGVWQRTAAEEP